MRTGRPVELTDEQRILNKKNLDSIPITIYVQGHIKERIDSFVEDRYRSRNAALLDLIKTHPDFLEFSRQHKQY